MSCKPSRRHHYLSQFYLRGFSKTGDAKSKIYVYDLPNKKVFKTNSRKIGTVRDFNTINHENIDPEQLEKNFSEIESEVAKSIKNIERKLQLEGNDFENIIGYISILALRTPFMRKKWTGIMSKISDMMLDLTYASQERWESQIAQMKQDSIDVSDDMSYEKMKKFHDEKRYTISLKNEFHIDMEMMGIETVMPLLMARSWMLIVAEKDTGYFVTNDSPVILIWKNPEKIPPFYRSSPGFGLKETEVIFPLTRKMALLGTFRESPNEVKYANKLQVASINTITLGYTQKQLYSATNTFFYTDKNRVIKNSKILVS